MTSSHDRRANAARTLPMLLLCAAVLACGDRHDASPPAATSSSSAPATPAPKLDPRLLDAFRSIKAGRYDEARRQADAYLGSADAKHPGQAAFIRALSYHEQQ